MSTQVSFKNQNIFQAEYMVYKSVLNVPILWTTSLPDHMCLRYRKPKSLG